MSYFDRVKRLDEQIRFRGKIHWLIYWRAGLCATLGTVMWIGRLTLNLPTLFWWFGLALMVIAFIQWAQAFYVRWTTEIFVTDKRVLVKRYLIARRTQEINLSKVETVDLRQSVIQRLLGAGFIAVIGTGGSLEPIGPVAAPVQLRNAIAIG
jgi:uncharacterized membrane protein YdbT with pleckstrin-like domain